jgi:hypothetical protein
MYISNSVQQGIKGGSKYVCIEITEVKTADDNLQETRTEGAA